ncbi:MAG TPA: hypothetical protein VFP68_06280, partial [Burkholderiaceae bacterium]|nr:hypothetical protein [Burkholderiaceae bacterium]
KKAAGDISGQGFLKRQRQVSWECPITGFFGCFSRSPKSAVTLAELAGHDAETVGHDPPKGRSGHDGRTGGHDAEIGGHVAPKYADSRCVLANSCAEANALRRQCRIAPPPTGCE